MIKFKVSKYILGGLVFFSSSFLVGCNNAEYSPLSKQAYIAQTNTNGNTSQNISVGSDPITTTVNVRISDPAAEDCVFEIVADPSALESYNQRNETSYQALPQELYALSQNEVMVNAGKTTSEPISLTINPLTDALKNSGQKYAIGLRLRSKDGKNEVLNSGSTMVYILDQVIYQSVPIINSSHNIHFTMRQSYNLTEWTVEMNVNMSLLGKGLGELNNQTLLGAWGNNGGEIYTRFGDAPIEGNRLQVKTQGTQMNSRTLFDANKWYHIAFVCTGSSLYLYINGVLDNWMSLPGNVTNISNAMGFGNQDYLKADVKVSELRFWTKARTQAQIQNNMYACDPTSEGLEAYWKLNEGEGNVFNDITGHGNTGTCDTNPSWEQNVRIDGK